MLLLLWLVEFREVHMPRLGMIEAALLLIVKLSTA
jgi:hypothetical protein